jgi:hypothetical protein
MVFRRFGVHLMTLHLEICAFLSLMRASQHLLHSDFKSSVSVIVRTGRMLALVCSCNESLIHSLSCMLPCEIIFTSTVSITRLNASELTLWLLSTPTRSVHVPAMTPGPLWVRYQSVGCKISNTIDWTNTSKVGEICLME